MDKKSTKNANNSLNEGLVGADASLGESLDQYSGKNSYSLNSNKYVNPNAGSLNYSPYTPYGAYLLMANKVQPGSLKGSIFTLSVAIVGAGMLSLPYALSQSGLVLGLLLLTISGIFTYFSLLILVQACDGIEDSSYKTLSQKASGNKLAIFAQLNLLLNLFGSTVSYMVASGGIIVLIYIAVLGGNDSDSKTVYRYSLIVLISLIVFPLALMRSMSSLRFTSLLSVCCYTYLGIVLIISYFRLCGESEYDHRCFWKSGYSLKGYLWNNSISGFLTTFPIFVFAYTCHQNVLPIYLELKRRDTRRMNKVVTRALGFALILYIIVSSFGYLTFLDGTCNNILLNKFHKHPEVVVAAFGIGISVVFTIPLFINAFRSNFASLFLNKNHLDLKSHVIITFSVLFLALLIAIFVSDISIVFGILGSTTNPIIGFILPSVFYCKIENSKTTKTKKIMAICMSIIVGSISLASLGNKIYSFIYPSSSSCDAAQHI